MRPGRWSGRPLTLFLMNRMDFDRQFRLMELAESDEEVERLSAEIRTYIGVDSVREEEWKAGIARWHNRSMIELATFRELMGQAATV